MHNELIWTSKCENNIMHLFSVNKLYRPVTLIYVQTSNEYPPPFHQVDREALNLLTRAGNVRDFGSVREEGGRVGWLV